MPRDSDLEQQVQSDIERVKRLNKKGTGGISPGLVLEYVLWGLAGLSVVFMLVVMPWVGQGGVLTGTQWLAISVTGMLVFGGAACMVRLVFSSLAEQYDRELDKRFQRFQR